jgi:hypothetical protein
MSAVQSDTSTMLAERRYEWETLKVHNTASRIDATKSHK